MPKLNQLGISQIILPLFLLAAIGLSVYLVQQRTNLIPFAQNDPQPPEGCLKVTTSKQNREVRWKNAAGNPDGEFRKSEMENEGTTHKDKWQYPFKEVRWTWTGGWKDTTRKIWPNVPNENSSAPDGNSVRWDRVNYGPAPTRFDSPDGKSYHSSASNAALTGSSGLIKEVLNADDGKGAIVIYSKFVNGTNYQGVPDQKTFEPNGSYAFVPTTAGTNCNTGTTTSTGSTKLGDSCKKPSDCKSGVCTNSKCVQGDEKGGDSCTSPEECQSNTCRNGKCAGGSTATGRACDDDKDCASNKCSSAGKCVASTSNTTTTNKTGGTGNNTTTNATNNTTGTTNTTVTTNTTTNTTTGTTAPVVSLTKAEIIGFKNNFDAVSPRLGVASGSGNLSIVSGLASSELNSIVSQLPNCPDDANVGRCVDTNFRVRFDFAKTAARLSVFYGIFKGVQGICVKADLGLTPLITSTSQSGTAGRVNLCNEAIAKVWRIFVPSQAAKFQPIVSTDTRFPVNPTCATLPTDVLTHLRNAEILFNNQAGFVQNTLCDGKTSVSPEDSTSITPPANSSQLVACGGSGASCPLNTQSCSISRIDSNWYCLPKNVFNKDFYCGSGEFGNVCPASHPSCDQCGQCRNSSKQILPGTPNPQDGLCLP